ncbi:MAG: HD domain-containing phosphohydrolase [Mariprofundaceae bacterium]
MTAVVTMDSSNLMTRIKRLNEIGVALSAEDDTQHLLEFILMGARELTHADGGTLYIVGEDQCLHFEAVQTDSLDIHQGQLSDSYIPMKPIPLYGASGEPNHHNVAAYVALREETVNITDAYDVEGFNFSGTKAFDKQTGYRSQSFLTVPMKNQKKEVIGVLQLINALDSKEVVSFSDQDEQIAESLASQAAVAITNHRLVQELRELMESFIKVIGQAIDDKSAYTGGHCRRVPELALMLADAACATEEGPLSSFHLTDAEKYEMKIAALMHDCGKITTPVHVVDKSTKLETIVDRIELVEARLEILRRDAEIAMLKRQLMGSEHVDDEYQATLKSFDEIKTTIRKCNVGGEWMDESLHEFIQSIASLSWQDAEGQDRTLLSDDELYNLSVSRGTLTAEERGVINHHIVSTIQMLESLPFPKHLQRVPEIAGGHHEHVDGSGYPKGLKRDEMSVEARILAIADIFEALTAADRPYKQPMALSKALQILESMKQNGHIDPDLFDAFVNGRVYQTYGEKFLAESQLDIDSYLIAT